MAKIKREEVIAAGLELLDEVGLDGITTRLLAKRLNVESPTLYWHFRDKAALLSEMAAIILTKHHKMAIPDDTGQWRNWFTKNARSFRSALRAHRDGARLHAGTVPSPADLATIAPKVAYLMRVGFSKRQALMALLTMSQFTIGCVMEEQTRHERALHTSLTTGTSEDMTGAESLAVDVVNVVTIGGNVAFEFGLGLILDGLRKRIELDRS